MKPAPSAVRSGVGATSGPPWRGNPIRLDLVDNPYGPIPSALDAVADALDRASPQAFGEGALRSRIATWHGVGEDAIRLAAGMADLVAGVVAVAAARGPLVLMPPSALADEVRGLIGQRAHVVMHRGASFGPELDQDLAEALPADATVFVDSPSDPTGALLTPVDAVRLLRACSTLIVDERHAGYGARSLLPLTREFDNLLVLRTFETWAGLAQFPLAYAVGALDRLHDTAAPGSDAVAAPAIAAATATLDRWPEAAASIRRVRDERSRLFRLLRKLNFAYPFPSQANYLLCRIERGDADVIATELRRRRDIHVHRPRQPEFRQFLRLSPGLPAETDALKAALLEIAPTIS